MCKPSLSDAAVTSTPASERSLAASAAADLSWAYTTDRSARTAPARRALDDKFLAAADGDPLRAASLRRAHFKRLALKSAQARRKARELTEAAEAAEAELADASEAGSADVAALLRGAGGANDAA